MASLNELKKEVKKQNTKLDGISDVLIAKLEAYQSAYEKLLLKTKFSLVGGALKRNTSNFTLAQKLTPMQTLGLKEIATEWVAKYPDVASEELAFSERIGIKTGLAFKDISLVRVHQKTDLDAFLTMGRGMDALIKRELVNSIALETSYDVAVANIARGFLGAGDKLGRVANWADAVMRTSVFGLTRSIDAQIYEDIGAKKFVYVGAVDKRTRPFCRARVGKEYTKKQIEKFGNLNGSGLPGFFSPGGFRCRHRMIASDV